MTFQLPFASIADTATLEVLVGAANASNTPTTAVEDRVVPVGSNLAVGGSSLNYTAPGYSISVLTVKAS